MLFLAVFCGFLAEYQLEHQIENDREKQYIKSLVEDLQEDTATLTGTIRDFDDHMKRNDSLIKLLTGAEIKDHGADLYYFGRRASRSVRLALHALTIQQMKGSGASGLSGNKMFPMLSLNIVTTLFLLIISTALKRQRLTNTEKWCWIFFTRL